MSESDELTLALDRLTADDFQRGIAAFRAKLRGAEAAYLQTCVRCGLCADSCHYHRADGELESIPAHKLDQIARVFRRHFTLTGRIAPGLTGARSFDRTMARAWIESVFGRCSLCGRCSLNCTTGINIPVILRAARGALTEMGLIPSDLLATVKASLETGNNMGITREDWIETVQWIEEEVQAATGDSAARIPIDKEGARVLFTVNPREPKFFPLTLQASAIVLNAAGEDWTVASEGWDLTNYGLFSGDPNQGGAISAHMLDSMKRLGCKVLAIGECGHGYAAARWESAEWLRVEHGFEMVSFLELMAGYLREGRIPVDPEMNPEPVTLHDPCNLVRNGGIREPQREILRRVARTFTEMTPHGIENFCCGGGGGQLSMGRYKSKRLQAGGIKAEQIRRTGAKIVVAPCHNCIDQLMELNREYKLGVSIRTVAEMVASAIVPADRARG
jgi:Fe-S oxidoreductase